MKYFYIPQRRLLEPVRLASMYYWEIMFAPLEVVFAVYYATLFLYNCKICIVVVSRIYTDEAIEVFFTFITRLIRINVWRSVLYAAIPVILYPDYCTEFQAHAIFFVGVLSSITRLDDTRVSNYTQNVPKDRASLWNFGPRRNMRRSFTVIHEYFNRVFSRRCWVDTLHWLRVQLHNLRLT